MYQASVIEGGREISVGNHGGEPLDYALTRKDNGDATYRLRHVTTGQVTELRVAGGLVYLKTAHGWAEQRIVADPPGGGS